VIKYYLDQNVSPRVIGWDDLEKVVMEMCTILLIEREGVWMYTFTSNWLSLDPIIWIDWVVYRNQVHIHVLCPIEHRMT
jgi:hypothetical protein